jgi:hypothetical protein
VRFILEERNWFTIEESDALFAVATSLGHAGFWKVTDGERVSCMICGDYICQYCGDTYPKHLVSHMTKHLKLKAFI